MIDEALEAEYNIRRRHPESPGHYARYAEDSARARAALRCTLDIPYGDSPGERLDLFPANAPRAPVLVFIHGGYWRALDKRDVSFIAPPFVAAGITMVLINYDLAPRVTVDTIVRQAQRGLDWVFGNLHRFDGDPTRVFVGGHSAGGQLTAMALLARPPSSLAGGIALSGVFDLVPLLRTNVNLDIRLDEAGARRNSPLHRLAALGPRPLSAPLLIGVGGGETRGFIDQSRDFAAALGIEARLYPTLDHYTIMLELARPQSDVHRDILRFMTDRAGVQPGRGGLDSDPPAA